MQEIYTTFANAFVAGNNFRTFIDILNNESGYHNQSEAIRFTSDKHQEAYTIWLTEKYGAVDSLNENWGMLDIVGSFDEAAKLIPVYTVDAEETMYVMNMESSEVYRADVRNSVLWDDYLRFREQSLSNLNNTVSDWLTSTGSTDVPVVIKHVSVLEDYYVNDQTVGGIDGIGGEIYGDFETATAKRTYPFSEVEQSAKTMWYIITECNTEENMTDKTENGPVVYESKEYMYQFFDAHISEGAKGIYDFLIFGDFFNLLPAYSYHSKPEAYAWSKEYREYVEANADKIISELRPDSTQLCYFYPGSRAWWFDPSKRGAALYEDDYLETRIFKFKDDVVMQTNDPYIDKDVLFVNLENAPATLNWGTELNEYLANKPDGEKVVYMGMRQDLGSIPVIDAYYTDEIIDTAEGTKIQVLKPTASSTILAQTEDGKVWALRDGDIYIISNTGWNGGPASNSQYTDINYLELLDFDEPDDPEDPEKPDDPENPEDPEKPEDSEDPEKPEDTENPEDPKDPVKPEDPEEPEKPEDSEKPNGSGQNDSESSNGSEGTDDENAASDNVTSPSTNDSNKMAASLVTLIGAAIVLIAVLRRKREWHNK